MKMDGFSKNQRGQDYVGSDLVNSILTLVGAHCDCRHGCLKYALSVNCESLRKPLFEENHRSQPHVRSAAK